MPRQPSPAEIRAAREAAGMTQEQAASVVWVSRRAWLCWENTARNAREMPLAAFELFCLKTGQGAFFQNLATTPC